MAAEAPETERPGPLIGLDLGGSRIGVAVSDPDGRLAVPIGTIRAGAPQDLKGVAALVEEHGATGVVVGHPLLLSGDRGDAARQAEGFAEALRSFLRVPVHLQDERLTSVEAERTLRSGGVGGRDRRQVVDQTSAAIILQAFLDANARGPERPDERGA